MSLMSSKTLNQEKKEKIPRKNLNRDQSLHAAKGTQTWISAFKTSSINYKSYNPKNHFTCHNTFSHLLSLSFVE